MEKATKGRKLRVVRMDKLGVHWPKFARLLISELTRECVENNRCFTSFAIEESPLSLNHQYENAFGFGKCKKSGKAKRFMRKKLRPEVHDFRAEIAHAMSNLKRKWSATGVTAAVVLFEDPVWMSQEFRARKQDADNKIKPLFDAIERASGVPDELHWQFHVFKVASTRQRTLVYLFDLGDIVEFYTKGS